MEVRIIWQLSFSTLQLWIISRQILQQQYVCFVLSAYIPITYDTSENVNPVFVEELTLNCHWYFYFLIRTFRYLLFFWYFRFFDFFGVFSFFYFFTFFPTGFVSTIPLDTLQRKTGLLLLFELKIYNFKEPGSLECFFVNSS